MSATGLEQLMIDGEVCQPGTVKKIIAEMTTTKWFMPILLLKCCVCKTLGGI